MSRAAEQIYYPTVKQVRRIHTLIRKLNIDDETYRAMLMQVFGVESSKFLTSKQAQIFIDTLQGEAEKRGLPTPGTEAKKFEKLKNRQGMATVAQLTYIDGLWCAIARGKTEKSRNSDLRAFITKTVHVSDMRFLTKTHAGKMIEVLKQMKKRAKIAEK